MRINICMAFDNNYAKYAGVTIASILSNALDDEILNFFILDDDITEENKQKISDLQKIKNFNITYVTIDKDMFEDYKKIKTHKYISLATYYRLKLCQLIPNIDKIIYLDCDIVVNSSLKELWLTDMYNTPIAGVKDLCFDKSNFSTYVNAGMLLMNLEYICNNNIEDKYLEYARKNSDLITCGDQEIINAVLNGKIKILNNCWNVQVANVFTMSSRISRPSIIHYIGSNKPWMKNSWTWYKEYYYEYLRLTSWFEEDSNRYSWLILENIIGFICLLIYKSFQVVKSKLKTLLF